MTAPGVSFLDVGHGDCTVAVDSDTGQGLVVDCPTRRHPHALKELEQLGCRELVAAIVTHSHDDHLGGIVDLLEALAERFTGVVYFNNDRTATVVPEGGNADDVVRRRRALFTRLSEYGERAQAAETPLAGGCGRIAWRLHAPSHADVSAAVGSNQVNLASAIVEVAFGDHRVLIGGDAQISVWDRVAADIPNGAVLRWPHHGGGLGADDADPRLYAITEPSVVVVSVGSSTHPTVPSTAFFTASQAHPSRLICTESTSTCSAGGGTSGVCAGTIRVALEPGMPVAASTDHDAVVNALGAPQCRVATGPV